MRHGRTIVFVMLALLAGGILAQLPLAAADDSDSPFGALWDTIFDLQSRDEQLQAQIDELRAERELLLAQSSSGEPAVLVSDLYATIEVEALEQDRTLVHITAGNNGPDRAAGVKLTAFYLMPLFEINSIDDDLCMDKSRGIIECIIGTLEQNQKVVITVDATARESGKANTWTVDVSTTTDDVDYSNNHVTYDFETGSGKPIEEIPEIQQSEEPEVVEEEPETTTEPEQDDDSSGVVPNNNSTEVEETKNTGNQTSAESEETPSENQTSTETQDSGSNNNNNNSNSTSTDIEEQESSESEVVDDDSGSNSTNAAEDEPEQLEEEDANNNNNEETQEEQPSESESSQPTTEEQQTQDEQSGSEESGSEPVVDEPREESPVEESSDSSQEESSESSESSEGGSSSSESSDSG